MTSFGPEYSKMVGYIGSLWMKQNCTFVTKGEFENHFLATPTVETKFYHWVNTTWNQLLIYFEPFSRYILKSYFKIHLFPLHLKIVVEIFIFWKPSSVGCKKNFLLKTKINYNWQDTCGKKCILLKVFWSCCFFESLKKGHILNFNKISLKK